MIDTKLLSENWTCREKFLKGHVIIVEGEAPDGKMFIIEEGSVGVFKKYQEPGEIRIAELNQGDFFGEMNMFLQKRRTATVVAETDVTVLAIERAHALKFLETQPEATFSLIKSLCIRLENTTGNTADNNAKYKEDLSTLNDEKCALEQTANTDALTGVHNIRSFMESRPKIIINTLVKMKSPYIILFDLDYFKKVNDTYGHQAGDYVLQSFASLVSDSVRTSDIFARYGGEEFIMLISCTSKDDAKAFLERLREKIMNLHIEFEGSVIPITSSIGVCTVSSENESDIEAAIALADRALYTAKNEGRNRVIFN